MYFFANVTDVPLTVQLSVYAVLCNIYLRMRDSIDVDLLKRMFSQQKYVVCRVAQEAHVAGAGAGAGVPGWWEIVGLDSPTYS